MPHINRIRVNNVKYNFGTQFYDDFVLRFSGKNTIYDLANGGGKSVLMLLLMQNMIPNCTLDEKQPIEKLFRTGSGSSTIHSLIEWQLNKDDIKNGYKYMTTGFCARKAREALNSEQEEVRENAAIEYFNYVIFYREFNDNDIKNLPLSNGKERITYHGLKNYLKELERRDYSLKVRIFERKGEYQQFISQYGIYESEWEIIRGINKTEGHVRTYFETNYRTTRKVVEDLLIEEILQKSYYNHTGEGEDFAKLLLDIKNKLVELTKKKKDINNYDRQIEALESFIGRIQSFKGMYRKKGGIEKEFVSAYYTCEQSLKTLEKQLEELLHNRQELQESKRNQASMVDTALVQVEEEELSRLDRSVENVRLAIAGLESKLNSQKKQLLAMENANDYLEYLEYKREYETAQIAASNRENRDELRQNLESLSACFYEKYQERKTDYTGELSQLIIKESQCTEQQKEQKDKLQGLQQEIALKNSRLQLLGEEKQKIFKVLEEQKNSTDLLLFEEAGSRVENLEKKQQEAKEKFTSLQEEEGYIKEQLADARLRMGILKEQKSALLTRQQQLAEFKQQYGQQRETLEKLEEFYGKTGENNVKEAVFSAFQRNVLEQEQVKQEIALLKKKQENYLKGNLLLQPQELEQALDIINVGKHRAVSGEVYLREKPSEEQTELLENCPVLPYSIVVFEDYDSVQYDKNLKRLGEQGRLLPVIDVKALEGSLFYDTARMDFLVPDKEWFAGKDTCEEFQKETLKELETQEKKLKVLQGRMVMIKADLAYLQTYESQYKTEGAKLSEEYEQNKLQVKDFTLQEEQLQENQQTLYEKRDALQEESKTLQENIKTLEKEWELYTQIVTGYESYCEIEAKEAQIKQQLEEANTLEAEEKDQLLEVSDTLTELTKQIENIRENLQQLEQFWQLEAKAFYPQEGEGQKFTESYQSLSIEELQVQFKGSKSVYLTKNADLADKEKLAQSYRQQMDKCLNSINYRGGNLEQLQESYQNMTLTKTTLEERKSCKGEIARLEEEIAQQKKELDSQSKQANRKFGSIEYGKTLVEEKYGVYKPLQLSGEELRQLIGQYKKLLANTEEQLKQLQVQEKALEKDQTGLETMKDDMIHMMESASIDYSCESTILEDGKSLKQTYKELKDLYEKIMKEEYERRETFEKDKNRLKETLILTNAHELAGEVEKHILSPANEEGADQLIENMKDTISCIQLEKSSVAQGIEDMEKIKHNFESQCIQTCINMKSALDRLPKLSGIMLDDKTIPMITLSIPYIKEELYESAMSDYINQVVQTADSFATENERVKYIRGQLAWKKLFSVIVKDMNLIKLNLYKRERIKEQSRYLKYEEAVGSTGQSQGIYIQFLVAIIHYITSVNSANSDPHKLKNVIFIDNPFGAAKDVYIWEPIFKLLKANNVQLIVPARGATPAITGRFEVNYVLGQKLVDNRQQTVVVDYRSQTEPEEMEYTSLSYQQSTLEF